MTLEDDMGELHDALGDLKDEILNVVRPVFERITGCIIDRIPGDNP